MNDASLLRVAVVNSHPIQHFCPQFCSWARLPGIRLQVFFASRHGLERYYDKDFGRSVQWAGLSLDFPHEFLPGADGRSIDSNTDCVELEAALDGFAPHSVIVYGYAQKLQRRAANWAAKRGVATFMVSDSTTHQHRPWWKRCGKALVLPRLYARIGAFLTVGDSNEAHYRRYGVGDDRMIRCPFPIDVARFDAVLQDRTGARDRIRAELGIPPHHVVLLMVGKLVPWKRQIDLVRLSNLYQGKRDDVTVVLAGTGRDQHELELAASRNGPGGVVFAGFVQPEALCSYYCAADIYVHCSEAEPHSLAISEAAYAGLPVLLSDRCGSYGPTDDVQHGKNGFVYRCGDLAQLARAAGALVDQPAQRAAMGSVSAELARSKQQASHGAGLVQAMTTFAMRASHPGASDKLPLAPPDTDNP